MGICIASFGGRTDQGPAVEGQVIYRGRPMSSGMVCFASEDRLRSGDMIASIDRQGHFACRPQWWKGKTGETRYRISIYPDPRPPRKDVPVGDPDGSPQVNEVAQAHPERDRVPTSSPRVVLASMGLPVSIAHVPSRELGQQPKTGKADPPRIGVTLDSTERVHVEINLRD
jgi:hypothetical protein